jgi:hypothetical protein
MVISKIINLTDFLLSRHFIIQELCGDFRREAIDIYDYIDIKELKEAYLACIPQLGIY